MAILGGRRTSEPLAHRSRCGFAKSDCSSSAGLADHRFGARASRLPRYFNELAGRHPERILITSDLDWGQDLLRLSSTLKEKRVQFVSVAYSGEAD
jgi:hypothetical protein